MQANSKTHWQVAVVALMLGSLACGGIGDAINNVPAVQTGQAVATQAGELGELAETAQAVATDVGPGVMETLSAAATDIGPEAAETAEALATSIQLGERPADIPFPDTLDANGAVFSNLGGSYNVKQPFADVLQWYKDQMPASGWKLESDLSLSDQGAILTYSREGREAILTFAATDDQNTGVILVVNEQ